MISSHKGILVAVEGIDGSGKSTLARLLTTLLQAKEFPVILTKEPGGTQLGSAIRNLLQEKPVPVSPRAEYLLFAADRAQHMEQLVSPYLEKKYIVISDRMGDSSVVYQGYGRGLDKDIIVSTNAWAMQDIQPNVTIYVKVDLDTAINRIIARNDKLTSFEQEKRDFVERLIKGFNELYKDRHDVIQIDGTQAADACAQEAYTKILTWIHKHNYYEYQHTSSPTMAGANH